MRAYLLAALASLAAACGDLAAPHYTSPTEVTLKVGHEVRVDSILSLTFVGVPADSRCPSSSLILCIWAGDGAVEIAYALGTGPSHPDTLHTFLGPKMAAFGGYGITLLELAPYPEGTGSIPQSSYVARFRIERVFSASG